jgi:hypothetical protein
VVGDTELAEDDFQGGGAIAAMFGSEDGAVCRSVGPRGPRWWWRLECLDDVDCGRESGGVGHGQAGVVVEDVQDLSGGVIGQIPVGDVGLPEFVGFFGGEVYPGAAGSFLWLCCDDAAAGQDALNSSHCRDFGNARVAGQVFGDGGRTDVVTLSGHVSTQSGPVTADSSQRRNIEATREVAVGAQRKTRRGGMLVESRIGPFG